jgi:hypothetical protein
MIGRSVFRRPDFKEIAVAMAGFGCPQKHFPGVLIADLTPTDAAPSKLFQKSATKEMVEFEQAHSSGIGCVSLPSGRKNGAINYILRTQPCQGVDRFLNKKASL